MSQHKQRPLWPLLTGALISLPALYVLSAGPVLALFNAELLPSTLDYGVVVIYGPVGWVAFSGAAPDWLAYPLEHYLQFWDSFFS